jgi:hypothetical protein
MSPNRCPKTTRHVWLVVAVLWTLAGACTAAAGERHGRRARRPVIVRPVPTVSRVDPVYGSHLGTFYPTPAVGIVGNYPSGVGYSPMGIYGEHAMSLNGPFSSFRTTTAPVLTYTRGYDGVVRPGESVSTSTPILPLLSPLAYPTRANDYYAPRLRDHPEQDSAINWIDHD